MKIIFRVAYLLLKTPKLINYVIIIQWHYRLGVSLGPHHYIFSTLFWPVLTGCFPAVYTVYHFILVVCRMLKRNEMIHCVIQCRCWKASTVIFNRTNIRPDYEYRPTSFPVGNREPFLSEAAVMCNVNCYNSFVRWVSLGGLSALR